MRNCLEFCFPWMRRSITMVPVEVDGITITPLKLNLVYASKEETASLVSGIRVKKDPSESKKVDALALSLADQCTSGCIEAGSLSLEPSAIDGASTQRLGYSG